METKTNTTMAKKKIEIPVVDAIDINALAKVNIVTNPNAAYSLCAFGTEFINWKNYIESDLETMKKGFMPRLGSIVVDREGNKYRFIDITLEEGETPVYTFNLSIVQE